MINFLCDVWFVPMSSAKPNHSAQALGAAIFAILSTSAVSQELILNGALDSFRPVNDWHGVANVEAVAGETAFTTAGEGRILVNGTTKNNGIPYLFTKDDYGDARIEMEFMVPKGSNSGVYVMGRYEVQILDSFGRPRMFAGDLGGIYQRWDPTRPEGQQSFEGSRPLANAAKAPGEWQTLDITFHAPRFDATGRKTADATFEKVLVNGVLVQQNATTTGPTRSAPLEGETTRGPVAIQGDHGPIAIRSLRVTPLADVEEARLRELDAYWGEVSRAVHEGDFESYKAASHPDAVLIAESKCLSQPYPVALERWRKDFDAAREGSVDATVEFRFSKRFGDQTTARETGMFRYTSRQPDGGTTSECVHLDALLVKRDGAWKILVENQTATGTEAEWEGLK